MCAGSPQLANRVAVWELVAQSIKMGTFVGTVGALWPLKQRNTERAKADKQ